MALLLSDEVSAALRRHAVACYPEECVEALVATREGRVFPRPLSNAADQPRTGFSLSARDYLAMEDEAQRKGLTVLGFYHSHPDAPAVPSARDASAAWPQWWTVIVPVTKVGAGQPRAWRFDEEARAFRE